MADPTDPGPPASGSAATGPAVHSGVDPWTAALREALLADDAEGAEGATMLAERWADRFPASGREVIGPLAAARAVRELESLDPTGSAAGTGGLRASFSPLAEDGERVSLTVYSGADDLELSRLVPVLESLGLWVSDEQHWTLEADDPGDRWHVYDVRVRRADHERLDLDADADRLVEAIDALWTGRADIDGLNRLVLVAGVSWHDVELLRALARYRRQIDTRYSVSYFLDVLVSHPRVARDLVALFAARFAPDGPDEDEAARRHDALVAACDAVGRLDVDRILRGMLGTVDAVVRTTWGGVDRTLAFKLDSARVPDVRHPVPFREIWVHGAEVHGIHLRAGPVARGGIRWSDRPQDLRSEVLDLLRAQVLKNALIVPTGAKGGFVLVGPAADEPAPEQVQRAYETFIDALLDLTDDRRGDKVVAVPGRLDDDDPYLVVAADRGTAHFSDVANRLAVERHFWLGDAFASGGSNGYDHKALGITARGAWTAVSDHFAELGVDVQTDRVNIVGIGDLSGDVFGNGLLRSESVALVAAFDHRDIFVDPDPDPAASFSERRRLFEQPASSWQDYDRSLISAGGGVFSRSTKRIELTRQMRDLLRLSDAELTPPELIRAILRAPVDLLFAGGIGTFVRASTEDDQRLDDRANSEVRVVASELRARVVTEGANLAFTQRARIEYARRGGRINVDAVDNAAGVDTSDREVNLKILLDLAVADGVLDEAGKTAVLREHTDAVVDAVLNDTRRQCERLTISHAASADRPGWFERVLHELVAERVVDPAIEVLPDAAELDARRGIGAGLTRPELAVVMAGLKRWLARRLLESELPDDPALQTQLERYFPDGLLDRFRGQADRHPLRRELIACQTANDVVDLLGITFVHRIAHDTGASPTEVVAAAAVAHGVTDAPHLWSALGHRAGDPTSDPAAREPRGLVIDLLDSLTRWELAHMPESGIDITERITQDQPVFSALIDALADIGTSHQRRARRGLAAELEAAGLAPDVVSWAQLLPELRITPDVAGLSRDLARSPAEVARAFVALSEALGLDKLAALAAALDPDGRWKQAAEAGLQQDLVALSRAGVRRALTGRVDVDPETAVADHLARSAEAVSDARALRRDVAGDPDAGLDGLSVAIRAVRRAIAGP